MGHKLERLLYIVLFLDHPLPHFVRHISENFISITNCDVKEIRLEAVKTCSRLMLPWLKVGIFISSQ